MAQTPDEKTYVEIPFIKAGGEQYLEYWSDGVLEYWSDGVLEYWTDWTLDYGPWTMDQNG